MGGNSYTAAASTSSLKAGFFIGVTFAVGILVGILGKKRLEGFVERTTITKNQVTMVESMEKRSGP